MPRRSVAVPPQLLAMCNAREEFSYMALVWESVMNRRLVATLAAAVLMAPMQMAKAQGGQLQFGAYETSLAILPPTGLSLSFSAGGSAGLSYTNFHFATAGSPPSPLIGTPSYGPPGSAFAFGGNGEWKTTTGVYLNAGGGTLHFALQGFTVDRFDVFVQYSDICFIAGPDDCDDSDPFFGERARITGVRTDGTTQEILFDESDQVSGDEMGAWYTLQTTGPAFKEFQARGSYIAIGALSAVPEPASIVLMASGLLGVFGVALRRRSKKS